MKKTRKVIKVCVILLLCWLIMCLTDFICVGVYRHKPIFCIGINLADDGGSGSYIGMGYSFYIKGNFLPEDKTSGQYGITSYESNLFGKEVAFGSRGE
ncbi:MAG: hypothetical protein J6I50_03285 [Clostridia bacterium]|nr:hypothetical protein [Clostridia bacterium]